MTKNQCWNTIIIFPLLASSAFSRKFILYRISTNDRMKWSTGWNTYISETRMARFVRIYCVVLKHRLCHRACYILLHRRNISVQIFSHDVIIESPASSCIHICFNLNLYCIRKQRWHSFFSFCSRPGISHYEESHAPGCGDVICRTKASVASGIECVHVHNRFFLILLLPDRNHIEVSLNFPANVLGRYDQTLIGSPS